MDASLRYFDILKAIDSGAYDAGAASSTSDQRSLHSLTGLALELYEIAKLPFSPKAGVIELWGGGKFLVLAARLADRGGHKKALEDIKTIISICPNLIYGDVTVIIDPITHVFLLGSVALARIIVDTCSSDARVDENLFLSLVETLGRDQDVEAFTVLKSSRRRGIFVSSMPIGDRLLITAMHADKPDIIMTETEKTFVRLLLANGKGLFPNDEPPLSLIPMLSHSLERLGFYLSHYGFSNKLAKLITYGRLFGDGLVEEVLRHHHHENQEDVLIKIYKMIAQYKIEGLMIKPTMIVSKVRLGGLRVFRELEEGGGGARLFDYKKVFRLAMVREKVELMRFILEREVYTLKQIVSMAQSLFYPGGPRSEISEGGIEKSIVWLSENVEGFYEMYTAPLRGGKKVGGSRKKRRIRYMNMSHMRNSPGPTGGYMVGRAINSPWVRYMTCREGVNLTDSYPRLENTSTLRRDLVILKLLDMGPEAEKEMGRAIHLYI